MAPPHYRALTLKGTGPLNRLISDIEVFPAFDPQAPPDPFPEPFKTKALWDTGATKSFITNAVAVGLNLVSTGVANVKHGGGQTNDSLKYIVNFVLINKVALTGAEVVEVAPQSGFEVILGMDVITLGDLSVTTLNNQTWMTFRTPSCAAIDYVSEWERDIGRTLGRNDSCWCGSGDKYKRCHGK